MSRAHRQCPTPRRCGPGPWTLLCLALLALPWSVACLDVGSGDEERGDVVPSGGDMTDRDSFGGDMVDGDTIGGDTIGGDTIGGDTIGVDTGDVGADVPTTFANGRCTDDTMCPPLRDGGPQTCFAQRCVPVWQSGGFCAVAALAPQMPTDVDVAWHVTGPATVVAGYSVALDRETGAVTEHFAGPVVPVQTLRGGAP